MKHIAVLYFIMFSVKIFSQSVGIGNTSPDPSALLDITSTTKGILVPRMDSISRTLIASPVQGLLVYQNNANKGFYYYNGTMWQKVGGDGNEWNKNYANEIYTTRNVGIGTSDPDNYAILDITSTDKGILIPRMTEIQRNQILNPDNGLLIFQTPINKGLYYFDGGDDSWKKVGDGGFSWIDGVGTVHTTNRVGIGTSSPDNSSVLELSSTNKGFLLPRMTTAHRDAIPAPKLGLKIFNTDDRCEDTYDGQKWAKNCDLKNNGVAVLPANNWRQRSDFPGGQRYFTNCFTIGTKIYVGLGQRIVADSSVRKDFWEYDTEIDLWTRKADFGGGFRTEAVSFSIGNKGYVGLGQDATTRKNDFWEYDPVTNIWTQKLDFGGTARTGAVGCSIAGKGYIGTGEDVTNGDRKDFWEFDPGASGSMGTWTQKGDFGGLEREYAVGFSIGSKGYIGTGLGAGILKDFWEYTPAGSGLGTWVVKSDFGGDERAFAKGFSIGSYGYIGTGNGSPRNEFWQYNPATNAWIKMANVGGKDKSSTCGCSAGTKGYFFTGYENNPLPPLKESWEYNTEPVNGFEYLENIPKDAITYKTHDWISEGNKLSTTLSNVNTEIRGTLNVADSSIIDGIIIGNNEIGTLTPYIPLDLQPKGGDLKIGDAVSPFGNVSIYGTTSMGNGMNGEGIINVGTSSRLKIDQSRIQTTNGGNGANLLLQPFGGNVGINIGSPSALLHLKGQNATDNRHIRLEDDNSTAYTSIYCSENFVVKNSSPTGDFYFINGSTNSIVLDVSPAGNLTISGSSATKPTGSGSWIIASDERLKKNILPYSAGLSDILKINPKTYNYNSKLSKDTSATYVGVIAQDLQKIAPYMIMESKDLAPDGSPYLQLDNGAMTYMLINAVKEQQTMIDVLKKQNEELNLKNEKYENQINALSSDIESIKKLLSTPSITKN